MSKNAHLLESEVGLTSADVRQRVIETVELIRSADSILELKKAEAELRAWRDVRDDVWRAEDKAQNKEVVEQARHIEKLLGRQEGRGPQTVATAPPFIIPTKEN